MAARPPGAERPCAVRRVQGGPQQAARLAAGRIYSARGRKGRGPRERRSLFRGRRAADVEPPYEAHLSAGQEAEVETAVCPDGGFRPGTLLSGVKKADALGFMQESLAEFRRPRTAESGPICFFRRHARQKNTSQAASVAFGRDGGKRVYAPMLSAMCSSLYPISLPYRVARSTWTSSV